MLVYHSPTPEMAESKITKESGELLIAQMRVYALGSPLPNFPEEIYCKSLLSFVQTEFSHRFVEDPLVFFVSPLLHALESLVFPPQPLDVHLANHQLESDV